MLEPGAKQVVEVEGTLSEDASYNDVRADPWRAHGRLFPA